MMAADLVAAVAADAFCIVGFDTAILYRQGFCRAYSYTFPAQLADFRIEHRTFYCQVLHQAESPLRHIVAEHGGIVEMAYKPVVFYQKVFWFLQRIADCFSLF